MENNKIKLDNIQISETTRTISYGDKTVVGDVRKGGLWVKINSSNYEHLINFIGKKDGFEELMNTLKTDDEKEYYIKLINSLVKIKVVEIKKNETNKNAIHSVSLELTTSCNLRCKHCSGRYGDKNIEIMSINNLKNIVQWAEMNSIDSMTLSGGEVFCLSDISERLEYVRKYYSGYITIITNATLINEKDFAILKRTVDEISISLDGYDKESVDLIRGKGVFEKVVNTIDKLHLFGYENISATMVLTTCNRKNIYKFKELCKYLKIKPITRVLSVRGRAFDNYESLVIEEEKGGEDKVLNKINMLSMCNAGISAVSFNANGIVNICTAIEQSNLLIGTVNGLDNISNNLDRMRRECIVDTIESCKDCLVRYFCNSMCYSININIFNNPILREKRCEKNKKKLLKHVWNIIE